MGSPAEPPTPASAPAAPERPDYSLATLVAGVVSLLSLFIALFVTRDPIPFLFVSLATGAAALVMGLMGRRNESMATAGAVMGGSAIAGTLLLVVVWVSAALVAIALFLFLFFLFFYQGAYYQQSGGCDCSGPSCDCKDCCTTNACDCGCSSCGSCGDCGGCGGGCDGCGGGGCGCVTLAGVLAMAPGRLAPVLSRRDRFAHHPDAPQYAQDVLVVRGARYCIGCFVTYPTLLAATLALALVPAQALAPALALPLGAGLAGAQLVSSAGLARRRWQKVAVKTALGVGLALVIVGVRALESAPAWKVLALGGVAALAVASAIPRARRMRRERAEAAGGAAACACATARRTGPTP